MSTLPIIDRTSKVFPLYSRANVGEIFPDPISPLNASIGFQACLETGWRQAFVACKVWDHDLYDQSAEKNILPAFNNYLYINMSLMRLFGVRVPGMTPEAVDLQYFGDMPGIPSYESEKRDFDENEAFSASAGAWLMEEVLGASNLDAYDADRAEVDRIRAERPDLTGLSTAELRQRLVSFEPILVRLFKHHIEASLKSGVGLGAVAQFAAEVGRPELALTLVGGIGDVDSTGPSTRMWALSRQAQSPEVAAIFDAGVAGLYSRLSSSTKPSVTAFVSQLNDFLQAWDFRGPSEWEIHATTWGVDPDLALAIIDNLRHAAESADPAAGLSRRSKERQQAISEIGELIAGNPEASGQFGVIVNAAALWLRGRERGRTTAAMLLHELRLAALELGSRAVARDELRDARDIFMLFDSELDSYVADPASYKAVLAERRTTYLQEFDLVPPFVVSGDVPPAESWERKSAQVADELNIGEVITGVSGCPGIVRGKVRVLLTPDDPSALEPDEILVSPLTDPSWTPLFMGASGVIVNVGAPFSHAAIVSRELGIPCIVSATNATQRLQTGDEVELDGTTGAVTLLSRH